MVDSQDPPQETSLLEYCLWKDDDYRSEEEQQHDQQHWRAPVEQWQADERWRYALGRQVEQVQKYAAECRRREEEVEKQLEAVKRHAAEARRGAEWAQAGAVIAVVSAAARAFFRK